MSNKQTPEPKAEKVEARIGEDLARRAKQKALRYGGLSAVVRALIRLWVEGDLVVSEDAIARANERAPKTKD